MPYLKTEDADIYFEVQGEGPWLLFLHGAGGNSASWWQQIPFFTEHFKCIFIDNRYFGRSIIKKDSVLNIDKFTQDTLYVLDHLKADNIGIVSQSMGGWIGLRLILKNQDRFWGFVSSNSPMGIDHKKSIENILNFSSANDNETSRVEHAALSENFIKEKPYLFEAYRQIGSFNKASHMKINNRPFFSELMGELLRNEFLIEENELNELKTPTLIIGGDMDPLMPAYSSMEISNIIPNSKLVIFENCGHSPYFEFPEIFNRLVYEYLTECIKNNLN